MTTKPPVNASLPDLSQREAIQAAKDAALAKIREGNRLIDEGEQELSRAIRAQAKAMGVEGI